MEACVAALLADLGWLATAIVLCLAFLVVVAAIIFLIAFFGSERRPHKGPHEDLF